MRKWKCTLCGYIHTGAEPPDECPVCGAPKEKFIEVAEDGSPIPAAAPAETQAAPSGNEKRKWKCTVCGYIHTGTEPPDTCPVCGAPKEKFIEVAEDGSPLPAADAPQPEKAAADEADAPQPRAAMETEDRAGSRESVAAEPRSRFKDSKYRVLFDLLSKYHGHPISVHIPNGLLPVAVVFIFLSAIFSWQGMASAAVYNMGIVALSMPLVLFTGWVDWQNRFNGAVTNVFTVKIACGIIVTLSSWLLFIWLLVNPEVVTTPQASRVAFFAINLIMLGAAGTAGWYGGKLVFRD